ncbi:MAG: hypothetical protein O3A96_09340 [Proteobacteria bacterium]|nr:hypothetical protein [Pseudomonadota bacterium]
MTTTAYYRLSIAPELQLFEPEIAYACDFLDRAHAVQRVKQADRILHYGDRPPAGALAVPAAIFPSGVTLDTEGIYPVHDALAGIEAGQGPNRLLPPAGVAVAGARLAYDALGLIFHQISRIEERDSAYTDRYGRFSIEGALATRQDSHLAPLADRAARDLASLIRGEEKPANHTQYGVLLTHDVDRLRGYHRPHLPLRYAAGDLVRRRDPQAAWKRIVVGYLSRLPWSSFNEIMDLSEHFGQQSRFYFMGPTWLSNDSPYVHTMPRLLRKLGDAVRRRGHIVGFHPGYATATDPAEWTRQREGLEAALGCPVLEGRQHTLRYDSTVTPDIWEDAGMTMDCTLSYPETSSFRAGTCRPFHGYSLRRRQPRQLVQHSTAVMDFGFFGGKYRDLTIEEALTEAARAQAVCRDYGGTLALLYHAGQPLAPQRPFYKALLRQALA